MSISPDLGVRPGSRAIHGSTLPASRGYQPRFGACQARTCRTRPDCSGGPSPHLSATDCWPGGVLAAAWTTRRHSLSSAMSSPFQPSALTLVELGKDFRHLLLESIDALILVGIVLLELVGPLRLCVDDFGHLRLRQSMVVRAARALLPAAARLMSFSMRRLVVLRPVSSADKFWPTVLFSLIMDSNHMHLTTPRMAN